MMIFKQEKDVPRTHQLVINNTNISPADERHHIFYDQGIPDQIILRSTQDHDHIITVDVSAMMVIGRKHSMRDREVNIDLTPLNAVNMGVSRYHAMMLALDNQIYLKDLDSLNGSLLNGKRMIPSKEYAIMERDIIAFGNLELKVEFVYL